MLLLADLFGIEECEFDVDMYRGYDDNDDDRKLPPDNISKRNNNDSSNSKDDETMITNCDFNNTPVADEKHSTILPMAVPATAPLSSEDVKLPMVDYTGDNDKSRRKSSSSNASPSSASMLEKSSASTPLPSDFEPLEYSVIIGRGKKVRESAGNGRLRVLCSTYLRQYSAAMNNKPAKTEIVNSIISIIRAVCPQGGAFIRLEKGRWCEVSDRVAREKVGYVFRDLLHDKYESSAQSKAARKKQREGSLLSTSSTLSSREAGSAASTTGAGSGMSDHSARSSTSSIASSPRDTPAPSIIDGNPSMFVPQQAMIHQQSIMHSAAPSMTFFSSQFHPHYPNISNNNSDNKPPVFQNLRQQANLWSPAMPGVSTMILHQHQQNQQQQQQFHNRFHSDQLPSSASHSASALSTDQQQIEALILEPTPISISAQQHQHQSLSVDDMSQLLLNSDIGAVLRQQDNIDVGIDYAAGSNEKTNNDSGDIDHNKDDRDEEEKKMKGKR